MQLPRHSTPESVTLICKHFSIRCTKVEPALGPKAEGPSPFRHASCSSAQRSQPTIHLMTAEGSQKFISSNLTCGTLPTVQLPQPPAVSQDRSAITRHASAACVLTQEPAERQSRLTALAFILTRRKIATTPMGTHIRPHLLLSHSSSGGFRMQHPRARRSSFETLLQRPVSGGCEVGLRACACEPLAANVGFDSLAWPFVSTATAFAQAATHLTVICR